MRYRPEISKRSLNNLKEGNEELKKRTGQTDLFHLAIKEGKGRGRFLSYSVVGASSRPLRGKFSVEGFIGSSGVYASAPTPWVVFPSIGLLLFLFFLVQQGGSSPGEQPPSSHNRVESILS